MARDIERMQIAASHPWIASAIDLKAGNGVDSPPAKPFG